MLIEQAFTGGRLFDGALEDGRTLFGRAFKTALRRELACGPGGPAELLSLWLEVGGGSVDELERRLYRCYSSRRLVRPECNLDALKRVVETSPLFEIDLEAEAAAFAAALNTAGVKKTSTNPIKDKRLPRLAAVLRNAGRSLASVMDRAPGHDQLHQRPGARPESPAGHTAHDRGVADDLECLPRPAPGRHPSRLPARRPPRAGTADDRDGGLRLRRHPGRRRGRGAGAERPVLVQSLRDRFRFALIDESQDTDDLQWAVFRRVFAESDGRNLVYFIGDPKQAIYGFRGRRRDGLPRGQAGTSCRGASTRSSSRTTTAPRPT